EEPFLERSAEELFGELDGAAGVTEDLHGFDSGEVIEEPAAARLHEHRVALHLEELHGVDALFGGERPGAVLREEAVQDLRRTVADDVRVGVTRLPGIAEEGRPPLLEVRRDWVV